MSAQNKKLTVPISEFHPAKDLTFTDFEENERSRGQQISYPRYKHPILNKETALIVQLNWTLLDIYGIPRANPDYYEDNKARSFIKYPIHGEKQQNTRKNFEELDKMLSSDEFKKRNFGKQWKRYKYIPIVRVPENDDDDEKQYPPYIKLKFEQSYPEGHITTQMYRSELNKETGKRTRTQYLQDEETVSLDQANELISYMSSIRPIVRLVKLWASKKREYGAVFKIPKIEIEPSSALKKNNLVSDWYKTDGFLDSDSEEEELGVQADNVDENEDSEIEESQEEDNDLDSDSDSDSESEDEVEDEDEVEVVVQKTKSKKGRKTKNSSA